MKKNKTHKSMAKSLFDTGIREEHTEAQQGIIRHTNVYAFGTFIFAIVLAMFLSFYDDKLSLVSFYLLVPAILPFVFNYLGLSAIGRYVFMVSLSWFITYLHAYMLVEDVSAIPQLIILQFVVTLLPWVITNYTERILIVLANISNYAIFLTFHWINDAISGPEQIEVVSQPFFQNVFLVLAVAFAIVFMLQLYSNVIAAEKNNIQLIGEREQKNTELEQQENELQKTLDEIHEKHKEDEKRSWSSNGITLVNKVLRSYSDDGLYQALSSEIVKYMKGFQGGIYIIEGKENNAAYLKLYGSYAYPLEKQKLDNIPVDRGYLGQACHEKARIYLEEIPEDYSKIQSALGESIPESLLLMPMIQEGQLEGVIELAFLRKLEQHEIEFIEEVSVILARFIESHQVNTNTRQLLEETQQQTEEMRAQEEEMRQNMEELQATQEEMRRKEDEYIKRIEELEKELNAG